MDKLEGVNKVIRASGKLPVPSLDTGGNSWAGIAERVIDLEDLQVQTRGWHYNTRHNVTVSPVLYTFDNATWEEADKRLTQADKFTQATVGQTIQANGVNAVVVGVDTSAGAYIVLDTDITTGGDASGISGVALTNRIAVPAGTLTVDADRCRDSRDITQEGGRLYNRDDNTDMFSSSVIITHVVRYEFNCLPLVIRNLIIGRSIIEFLRTHGPQDRVGMAERELQRIDLEARKWETKMIDPNIFKTAGAQRLMGRRVFNGWPG